MQAINNFRVEAGQAVQIRALKQTVGTSPAIHGKIESLCGGVLAVTVAEPVAAGTVAGIETPDVLILGEAADACRWGPGFQVTFKVQQVIQIRTDLHNLVAAVNRYGVNQGQGAPARSHLRHG